MKVAIDVCLMILNIMYNSIGKPFLANGIHQKMLAKYNLKEIQ